MSATIRDLMTSHVHTLSPEDDLLKAEAIMNKGRIRHLPVVNGDRLVGLITHRELLRAQLKAMAAHQPGSHRTSVLMPAADFMQTNVLTTSPDASPAEVARQLLGNKIGCLPVVEGDKLVGIVSEADFVKWALETNGRTGAS